MTREELIVALEAATGPSRELDEWIATVKSGATREVQKDGRIAHHKDGFWVSIGEVLPYTSSLDAALTLVPEGWVRRNSQIRFGMWLIQLWRGDKSFREPPDAEGVQGTEPIALCIAALRARGDA